MTCCETKQMFKKSFTLLLRAKGLIGQYALRTGPARHPDGHMDSSYCSSPLKILEVWPSRHIVAREKMSEVILPPWFDDDHWVSVPNTNAGKVVIAKSIENIPEKTLADWTSYGPGLGWPGRDRIDVSMV